MFVCINYIKLTHFSATKEGQAQCTRLQQMQGPRATFRQHSRLLLQTQEWLKTVSTAYACHNFHHKPAHSTSDAGML